MKNNKSLYLFFVCSFIFVLLFSNSESKYRRIDKILFNEGEHIVYIYENEKNVNKYGTTDYIDKEKQIEYLKSISNDIDLRKIGVLTNYSSGHSTINIYNFKSFTEKDIKTKGFSINYKDYEEIKNTGIYGEYLVKGNHKKISDFVNRINQDKKFEAIEIDKKEYLIGLQSEEISIIYLMASIILFALLLLIILKSKYKYKKSISIYKMHGYSNKSIILKLNYREYICIISMAIVIFTLYYVVSTYPQIRDLGFFIYMSKYALIYLAFVLVFDLIVSMFITKKVDVGCLNRQTRYKYARSNKILISIFTSLTVALLGMLLNYTNEYQNRNIGSRIGEGDYITLSTDFRSILPREINTSTSLEMMEKQVYEWMIADNSGGPYISPGNKYLGNVISFKDAEFEDDYVVINNNYLDRVKIYDINGKRIRDIKNDKYTITVLLPEKYKSDKRVRAFIKTEHMFRSAEPALSDEINYEKWNSYDEYVRLVKEKNYNIEKRYIGKERDKLKENIIYIDNNQKFDSLNNEFPLNEKMIRYSNYIVSPIVFIINGENYRDISGKKEYLGGSLYFSAINNEYIKFKIDDVKNPDKEALEIINKAGLSDRFTRIDTINGKINRNIIAIKKNILTYLVLVVLMLSFSIVMIKTDLSEYIECNKKKISIKYFMGYSRFKIFSEYIRDYIIKNIFSLLYIVCIWKIFYMYIKMMFYYEMDFMPVIGIYIAVVLYEGIYLILKIKKSDIGYLDLK